MECFVYVLQSKKDGSFYKGSTDNLRARVKRHNAGLDEYTRKYLPWNLVWYTIKPSKSEARILERKLKNLSVKRLIEFIRRYPVPNHFSELNIAPIRESQ